MKKIVENIDFADSEYMACATDDDHLLIIYLKSWDDKKIKIEFFNTVKFNYSMAFEVDGLYERSEKKTSILLEALALYYEKIPKNHPFKTYVLLDINGISIFEVVAEGILVTKSKEFYN